MRLLALRRIVPLLAIAVTCACGGSGSGTSAGGGTIWVDGSSTVFLISEAVAEEFQRDHGNIRVPVGSSGSGGGFQKFCRGETDISNASRPIRPAELAACKAAGVEFIELPIAYDGIAIVVNPRATWVDRITVSELRTIWAPEAQGQITRWHHVRPDWPDREMHLFGPGVDSGTYDYFTEAVSGKEGASRGDFTSSEDDNVLVQGVAGDELALGFLPYAYYEENKQRLKLLAVDDERPETGDGPIPPSVDAIRTGRYQPLSRPLFIYISTAALERSEVQQFVDFYLAHVGELAEEVGYVQLGDEGYRLVREHLRSGRTGTMFGEGGSQVGITIEQLLSRERAR